MGRAPYKSAKEGGGRSFDAFTVTTKERSCHVYSDSMPSKQITGQIIMYNGTTSSLFMCYVLNWPCQLFKSRVCFILEGQVLTVYTTV